MAKGSCLLKVGRGLRVVCCVLLRWILLTPTDAHSRRSTQQKHANTKKQLNTYPNQQLNKKRHSLRPLWISSNLSRKSHSLRGPLCDQTLATFTRAGLLNENTKKQINTYTNKQLNNQMKQQLNNYTNQQINKNRNQQLHNKRTILLPDLLRPKRLCLIIQSHVLH